MPDDGFHHRPGFLGEGPVAGLLHIQPHDIDQQQGRVDGVVHGLGGAFGEEVGHQAVLLVLEEGAQDGLGVLIAPGGQAAAGQGDHGIAAPVAEEGIAGEDGLALGRLALSDISVRRADQLQGNGVSQAGIGAEPGHAVLVGGDDVFSRIGDRLIREHGGQGFRFTGQDGDFDAARTGDQALFGTAIGGIVAISLEDIGGLLGGQHAVGGQVDRLVGGGDGIALDGDRPGFFRRMALLKAQHEGPHGQRAGVLRAVLDGVAHGGGVVFESHGGLAGHADAAYVVGPGRRVIHRQGGQVQAALFRGGFVREILSGEVRLPCPMGQRFLQPGHEGDAVIGGGAGADEEALVGTGHGKSRGQGGISAQAVGQQVTVLLGAGQIRHVLPGIHKTHT